MENSSSRGYWTSTGVCADRSGFRCTMTMKGFASTGTWCKLTHTHAFMCWINRCGPCNYNRITGDLTHNRNSNNSLFSSIPTLYYSVKENWEHGFYQCRTWCFYTHGQLKRILYSSLKKDISIFTAVQDTVLRGSLWNINRSKKNGELKNNIQNKDTINMTLD